MRAPVRPFLPARRAALLAATSGVLFALAHPPVSAWPLALASSFPLFVALAGRDLRSRALLGSVTGLVAAWLAAIGPGAEGAARFLSGSPWQGFLLAALTGQLFGVVGFATFAALAGDPARGNAAAAVVRGGVAFATAELVRAEAFGGLPWLLLAYALAPAAPVLQLASLGGVTALSTWLGACSAAIARLVLGPDRRAALVLAIGLAALVGMGDVMLRWEASRVPGQPAPPGTVSLAALSAFEPGSIRVSLVQPGLPLDVWADPLRAPESVARLVSLTLEAGVPAPDLVVWPENAVQAVLPANETLVTQARETLGAAAPRLLLGAPRSDPSNPAARRNAALLYEGTGPPRVHDKVRLLPFFETMPAFVPRGWTAAQALVPGETPRTLDAAGTRIGPLICYEILFPELAHAHALAGAGLLVNLSNDAWFGASAGAEQHFAAAVVLAATLRRPVLRSTPTGVTAAVDAWGRVVARLPLHVPGRLDVLVTPRLAASPATRLGSAPAVLAVVLALAFLARDAIRRDR